MWDSSLRTQLWVEGVPVFSIVVLKILPVRKFSVQLPRRAFRPSRLRSANSILLYSCIPDTVSLGLMLRNSSTKKKDRNLTLRSGIPTCVHFCPFICLLHMGCYSKGHANDLNTSEKGINRTFNTHFCFLFSNTIIIIS